MGIWTLSCLLAAPLFIWRTLEHKELDFPDIGLSSVDYCFEEWPTEHGRAYYSLFTIIFQYLVPVTIISFAYLGICKKLRYRMRPGGTITGATAAGARNASNVVGGCGSGSGDRDNRRVRRTNALLISIAVIFGISWMPLNVFNVVADFENSFKDHKELYLIIYAMCHMAGMSSACSNPLLYGWLNENFRKEFKEIWSLIKVKLCCGRASDGRSRELEASHHRLDRDQTTVLYRKSKGASPGEDGDIEQSTLITQVLK